MNGIQDIYNIFQFSLNPGAFVRDLAVAFICGVLISRFYCWSSKSSNNSWTFVNSLVSLTMITAVVIIVIGNNLARAFGLVGAMSIIRFRTAVKDIQDIVFIFFSLAIGIAAGIGLSILAFIGTLAIGTVILIMSKIHQLTNVKREYLLQFAYVPSPDAETPYQDILGRYCSRHHLVNTKFAENTQHLELAFYIKFRDPDKRDGFVFELSKLPGVKNINLFFDEE
jgi:uncharacterized membrane protein YhiD involved in acid resistance